MKLYQAIVQNDRLLDKGDMHYANALRRQKRIEDMLPSGSGIDTGTTIAKVEEFKIVLCTAFHHIDENGFYDGWTEHRIYVRYSMLYDALVVDVKGRNRNDIKDYLADVYQEALKQEFDWISRAND